MIECSPKWNWVQEHFREGEKYFHLFGNETQTKSENDSYCYSCLSLVPYIWDFFFRFFPPSPLELKKTNRKKNFNFLLSTWCCYWMWVRNAFEDVFIHSTLELKKKKSTKRNRAHKNRLFFKKKKWFRNRKKIWNGISMIKTLSKFNFLSIIPVLHRCLTFMTWKYSLWKCSSSPWFVRNCCEIYQQKLKFWWRVKFKRLSLTTLRGMNSKP